MTVRKWMRLSLIVVSAKTAARAFGLLLCSAALCYIGYVHWNLSWLGNVAATVIVASMTAVIVDRVIVGYHRRRLSAVVDSALRRLGDRCDALTGRVNDIRDQADRARPEPPYWIATGGYTSAGVEDSWRFALDNLDEALVAWTVLTGYSRRSVHLNAINTLLSKLRDAYTDALDAATRLAAHADASRSVFDGILGQRTPQPDKSLLVAAHGATDKARSAADAAVASIEALKTDAGREDLVRWVQRRRPFQLPVWLQVATLLMTAAWTVVLVWAWLVPDDFPADFIDDNLLNIAANIAIALFAGTLTIALVQSRRVDVAAHALPHFVILERICRQLGFLATPPGHADLQTALAQATDTVTDLSSAIQNECASAELSFWTTLITAKMRRLAAAETPLSISEADAVNTFFGSFRPSSDPVLDADTQALLAQQMATAHNQPSAPSHELIGFLEDLLELTAAARAAAEGRNT